MGFEIRRASTGESAEVCLLLDEYYEVIGVMRRDTPEEIASYLAEETAALWIGYEDGLAAGCVVLRPLSLPEPSAECKRLFVRERFRGRGIAEALLDTMETYAIDSGVRWIYLDSMESLTAALRMYEKRGYRRCERYNENPQATIFMRKDLGYPKSS